jgi:hypothetical protein
MDRKIRWVGEAYKQIIADWRDVLPTQSVVLSVPVLDSAGGAASNDAATRARVDAARQRNERMTHATEQ